MVCLSTTEMCKYTGNLPQYIICYWEAFGVELACFGYHARQYYLLKHKTIYKLVSLKI